MTCLCVISLLSGCGALVFEALLFHQAGLFLGSSVWTVSIVVAAYMLGCALGTAWAGRFTRRYRNPYAALAVLQCVAAISGITLVVVFPRLPGLLAGVFGPFLDIPPALNALRLAIAFVLMAVPCFCMGATLPLLNASLDGRASFAVTFGTLYGFNTLGAVMGVLAAEVFFVRLFGITGAAWCAAAFHGLAAGLAILWRRPRLTPHASPQEVSWPHALRPLVFSFCAGVALLALEVAWFRFFVLFFNSLSLYFALLLAVLLAGSCCGSLVGGWLARRSTNLAQAAGWCACICAVLLSALYRILPVLFQVPLFSQIPNTASLVFLSLVFIFPVAAGSGMYVVLLAGQVRDAVGDSCAASAAVITANTVGCLCGSLACGLLLIPSLGVERTFWLCACVYAVCGCAGLPRRASSLAAACAAGAALVLFPFGQMRAQLLDIPVAPFWEPGMRRVDVREGVGETIQLLRQDLLGEPYYYSLITNSHSMSSTSVLNRRYMYYFSFLPLAVKPDIRRALVISYGIGNTAAALLDEQGLERLDVVDVSQDIYDVSSLIYERAGAQDPLRDHRVRAYVEDGRFFLMTRDRTYDLITAEPPPPKNEGVVNLYTREFFALVKERLAPGGMVTYWLPVMQLRLQETKAIVAAFRSVFPDCMLFAPVPSDWVMVGTNGYAGPAASVESFKRIWFREQSRVKLYRTGYMTPDHLAALFVTDGDRLLSWLGETQPLSDEYPLALSAQMNNEMHPELASLLSAQHSRAAFLKSPTVPKMFCQEIRWASKRIFMVRNHLFRAMQGFEDASYIGVVHAALQRPLLQESLLWALGSDYDALSIITAALKKGRSVTLEDAGMHLAARAVFERDFERAGDYYARLSAALPGDGYEFLYALRLYLLYAAGRIEEAPALVSHYVGMAHSAQDAARRRRNTEALQKWLESALHEGV